MARPLVFPRVLAIWRSATVSLALLFGGLAAWGLCRLLPHLSWIDLGGYGAGIGGSASRLISLATGAIPFSIADLVYLAYAGWLVLAAGIGARAWRRGERSMLEVTRRGALRVCRHAGAVLLLFYALWGINYARPPLAEQMEWPTFSGIEPDELLPLFERATLAMNEAYFQIHGVEDAGVPTALPAERAGRRELEDAVAEGWRLAATLLGLPARAGARYGGVKWAGGAGSVTRVGFRGNYVFFTGEANVVGSLPAVRLPLTMAHEMAHQRGVSRESDANFLGFVAAAHAPHPLATYAAAVFAYSELLRLSLGNLPREELMRIVTLRHPGVLRDLSDWRGYHEATRNRVTQAATAVTQHYLVSQGVPQGREDYQRSVYLVVEWLRASGWPEEDGGPGLAPAARTALTAHQED